MQISAQFQGGSIEVVAVNIENTQAQLRLRPDSQNPDFLQWFYFRVQGVKHKPMTLEIMNAGASTYHEAWNHYQACYSYDREFWQRNADTHYDGSTLSIKLTPEFDEVFFAYFAPYSWERHLDLINTCQFSERLQVEHLGTSSLGLPMDLIVAGTPSQSKKNIWIIARQHPSETMAEWFMEGLLERLLQEGDGVTTALLQQATLYLVPNMNPDGTILGHTRTNGKGFDLNREWQLAKQSTSPEVFSVKQRVAATGVDAFFDIHGDEAIPYLFLSGCEGIPSYDAAYQHLEQQFKTAFARLCPEFQEQYGYEQDAPGAANLGLAAPFIAETYHSLAYTLEMPFKDTNNLPHPGEGWSPERAKQLGAMWLNLLWQYLSIRSKD